MTGDRKQPSSSYSYSSSSLVPYKILIHEDEHKDEYEKNQTLCALFLIPYTM
jgi:hypothetical protein